MKIFLTSLLGQLARTLEEVGKARVEKLTLEFLNRHSYFSQTWGMLNESQIKQVLVIIVSGKGVIPYKKITLLTVIICVWSLCCSIWVDRKLHFLQILLGI